MANSSSIASPTFTGDPVWKRKVTFLIAVGGGSAEMTQTVNINGLLQDVVIEVGTTNQGSVTVNVDFDDDEGVEFSANASLAESSDTILSFSKPIAGSFDIRVDPGDDPDSGADWIIVVSCRGL